MQILWIVIGQFDCSCSYLIGWVAWMCERITVHRQQNHSEYLIQPLLEMLLTNTQGMKITNYSIYWSHQMTYNSNFSEGYNIICLLILHKKKHCAHRFGFVTVKSSLIKQKQHFSKEMPWKERTQRILGCKIISIFLLPSCKKTKSYTQTASYELVDACIYWAVYVCRSSESSREM